MENMFFGFVLALMFVISVANLVATIMVARFLIRLADRMGRQVEMVEPMMVGPEPDRGLVEVTTPQVPYTAGNG